MEFKKINFIDTNKELWNKELLKVSGPQHLYTWQNLSYYSAYKQIENKSFLLYDNEKNILGIFPIAINNFKKKTEFAFGNGCCPYPLISSNLGFSKYTETINFYYKQLNILNENYKVNKIKFLSHPLHMDKDKIIFSKNQFSFLKYTNNFFVQNLLVENLDLSLDQIFEKFSRSRKRDIKIAEKKKLDFFSITSKNTLKEITMFMEDYKKMHFDASGIKTRPDKTWEVMLDQIVNNEANLFFLKKGDKYISFLYAGIFKEYAWCWSQVNKSEYEKEFMPRHLIEWEVIKFLKKNKFKYYEIGSLFNENNNYDVSKKELSISSFVEKFGGELYPKVYSYYAL